MKYDISVIGPLNIDILLTGDTPPDWESLATLESQAEIEITAAGSAGYIVEDMAKLGAKVSVCGCVGGDFFGSFIIEHLKAGGVHTDRIKIVKDRSSGVGIYVLVFGSRKRPLFYRVPAHDPWPRSFLDEEKEALLDTDILHNGGYLHFRQMYHGETVGLYREAQKRGIITSLDPQFPLFKADPPWISFLEDILPYVRLFFCDEHEACNITAKNEIESAAEDLLTRGLEMVVIKQGSEGSDIFRKGWRYHQQAIELGQVVDTIGAGDAYDAAFLIGILEKWPLEKCALFASTAAGLTVTGVGGSQAMPDRKKVGELMLKDIS
ncbi:MAG: carbohydrate kinase family protein [Spirochaetota bacterium]